jgi:hypothetical protein
MKLMYKVIVRETLYRLEDLHLYFQGHLQPELKVSLLYCLYEICISIVLEAGM